MSSCGQNRRAPSSHRNEHLRIKRTDNDPRQSSDANELRTCRKCRTLTHLFPSQTTSSCHSSAGAVATISAAIALPHIYKPPLCLAEINKETGCLKCKSEWGRTFIAYHVGEEYLNVFDRKARFDCKDDLHYLSAKLLVLSQHRVQEETNAYCRRQRSKNRLQWMRTSILLQTSSAVASHSDVCPNRRAFSYCATP